MSVNVSKVPASAVAMISSLENRVMLTKLLIGAVVGLCVGAIIGGLAFGALGTDTTATAFLRLRNPADLAAIAGGASQVTPDNQGNTGTFVAGEIAYLSGEGFAAAVGRKMAKDEPALLNVAQVSDSAVITMSCSRGSADEAVRTLQTAIDLYGQELSQRVDEQLRTILPTLSEWQQRDAVDATRMQELQRVRESIELQAAEASTLLVVQPPTPNQRSSHQWLIGMFLGGLVGGAGVVAVLLARRRRSGRGSLVQTLTENVDGVLLPAVDLDLPTQDARTDEQVRLARTLHTQVRSAGPNRVILVIGASPSSGGSVVASLLGIAAAEGQPAMATGEPLGQHSRPMSAEPGATRVVDGGAVGDPTLTPSTIRAATDIVLAARIEFDGMSSVLALRAVTASSTAPVMAVFTYRGWQLPRFKSRRTEAAPSVPAKEAAEFGEERHPK